MTSLAAAWETLTGPRVEDFWVEVLDVAQGTSVPENLVDAETSDFEGGTTGASWGGAWFGAPEYVTIANSTTRAYSGSHSMLVTFPDAAAYCGPALGVGDLTPGVTYTMSAWVYLPTGSPVVQFGDPFGNTSMALSDPDTWDQWQRLSVTFVAPSEWVYPTCRSTTATTGTEQMWLDDFRVVEGSTTEAVVTRESPRGALDGVVSCRVEHNVNAPIRGGCQVTLRDTGADLDWSRVRFRPWVRVNDLTWPLGVFLPASPTLTHDEHGSGWEVPCLDKLSILDQDATTETYSLAAGVNVTDTIASLIASTGETSNVTASDLVTRSPMAWEPGTTKLRIVNDLLSSINYFSLWADRRGRLRAEPYRRPQDRPVAAPFARGEASIHSPVWTREQDIAGVPNRVVLIVEGDDVNPGMVSTADNTDERSPYSIPSRGRAVVRVYEGQEASSQEVLDGLAVRYLDAASTPSATLSVPHAVVPLDGNAVVRFTDDGIDTLTVVEGYSVNLTPRALTMSGTWREVLS